MNLSNLWISIVHTLNINGGKSLICIFKVELLLAGFFYQASFATNTNNLFN